MFKKDFFFKVWYEDMCVVFTPLLWIWALFIMIAAHDNAQAQKTTSSTAHRVPRSIPLFLITVSHAVTVQTCYLSSFNQV